MPRLLYIGCLGYGNAGDDACLAGSRALLEPLLPEGWEMTSLNGYDLRGDESFDALMLGGGTLLSPHGNLGDDALKVALDRGNPYFIFGTGLESYEWEGSPEKEQREEFIRLVEGARLIGVRGPNSRDYLTRLGISPARVEVVGDPAVMVSPSPWPPAKIFNGRTLGVNFGTSFGRIFGGNEEEALENLAECLRVLACEGWCIRLFPVWEKDRLVTRGLEKRLEARDRVSAIDFVPTPGQLVSLLSQTTAAIAMKLHAGVFCAMAGTPYIPLAYRPKVEDFAAAVGMSEFVIRTDAGSDQLLDSFRRLCASAPRTRSMLATEVESMRARLADFARRVVAELC